jgi:IS5 family transposase
MPPVTLGGDKGYDSADFVMELRERTVTPHIAQHQNGRRSAIDGRTTRHPGYAISQCIRKRIEEAFGWAKTVAGLRKMRHRGLPRVDWQFTLAMAACDLVRLRSCPPAQIARPANAVSRPFVVAARIVQKYCRRRGQPHPTGPSTEP